MGSSAPLRALSTREARELAPRAPIDVPFTAELEALRRDFLAGLGDRRHALQMAAETLAAGELSSQHEIDQQLHNLIGSAGSHGAPELTAWARDVREALWKSSLGEPEARAELVLSSLPSFEGRAQTARRRPPEVLSFEAPLDRSSTVLLVDDDPAMHRLVRSLLSLADYETVCARTGAEARAVIEDVRPSLILLDTTLRDEDGFQLFRQLRADGRLAFVPILFMSSLSRAADVARGFRMGADDYVAKPIEPESFLARIVARLARARSLAEAAVRDPLTGLYNRRHTDQVLAAAVSASRRRKEPLAVALCDLDDFKRLNDTRGHVAGDLLLRGFATALDSGVRLADTTCRWGGEEFMVVLPRCDDLGAVGVMVRIRRQFEAAQAGGGLPQATFSAGVAMLCDQDEDAAALVRRADAALYRAKSEGKDRVAVG